MSDEIFGDRRQALEEAFFRKHEQEAIDKIKGQQLAEDEYKFYAAQHGITDHNVVDTLRRAGVHPATLSALLLVPLIEVAWADFVLDEKERQALDQAARAAGIKEGSEAEKLLHVWFEHKPDQVLHDAWASFVQALVMKMDPAAKANFRNHILEPARRIARASGGILGIGRVSAQEQKVLDNLDIWLT